MASRLNDEVLINEFFFVVDLYITDVLRECIVDSLIYSIFRGSKLFLDYSPIHMLQFLNDYRDHESFLDKLAIEVFINLLSYEIRSNLLFSLEKGFQLSM